MDGEPVDFSVIGELRAESVGSSVQSAELVGLETNTLAQEKLNYETEQVKHDIEKKGLS